MKFYDLVDYILNIILPENLNCFLCDLPISKNNSYSICKGCFCKLSYIGDGCRICGKPIKSDNSEYLSGFSDDREYDEIQQGCDFCRKKSFLFDKNISILEYNEASSKIVFKYKYGKKTFLARVISDMMCDILDKKHSDVLTNADFVTFVPLSKVRMKERGFNQSEKLAKYICERYSLEAVELIKRVKNTKKLYGLNSSDRKKVLRSAFEINPEYRNRLNGKKVIIIDDIFTSGSTINEISKILRLNGVFEIVSITFLTGEYKK
ncbi:ComF family protein [Peptostreptococcus sp. D1]|uniref:ComF family protein n=1 Tax=Peptostreptococcus sp. D1 TaxID=72304 RepID=UPI001160862F|nr:ComF family protein [Peptostreptococcus sp. D1]